MSSEYQSRAGAYPVSRHGGSARRRDASGGRAGSPGTAARHAARPPRAAATKSQIYVLKSPDKDYRLSLYRAPARAPVRRGPAGTPPSRAPSAGATGVLRSASAARERIQ